ncbi:MAG: hypothetical protein MPL62_15580 [Alphaproteobacteria bacterium]|nr:hypothetical protein [Alphaproteobacteria bacterium]
MAEIKRSTGVNESEKILGQWCDRAFLEAWTYHNPHRAKGTELCDSLVVFNGHILIFQIKEIKFSASADVHTAWERWKRKAFTAQLKSLEGAKNWILNHPDRIYQDAACKKRLPIDIASGNYKIHKILVANGSAEAGKKYFGENIAGSPVIIYGHPNRTHNSSTPFLLVQDKQEPVHVLDEHSLAIVLGELDTACDFTEYLLAKECAIQKYRSLVYRGEEELLANYLLNFDERKNQHYIGASKENVPDLVIEENAWRMVLNRPDYKLRKEANQASYLWDALMHGVCELALKGSTTGNDNLFAQRSPIYEMAKEPRVIRRFLAEALRDSLQQQENSTGQQRLAFRRGSYYESTAYVFLWVDCPSELSEADFFEARQTMLEIACGSAKNLQPQLTKVVGIAYGYSRKGKIAPEDFMLMECKKWTGEQKLRYEEANKVLGFFGKDQR